LIKYGLVVFKSREPKDRRTNRHTDHNILYLSGGTKHNKIAQSNFGTGSIAAPKTPLPLSRRGHPSNTPMPRPTPRTTPNHSFHGSHTFAQLCRKLPIGYNGAPHIRPQNYPFREGVMGIGPREGPSLGPIPKPNYLPHTWNHPTYHPKPHPYPISRFATMHWTYRQADIRKSYRPTDGWRECSMTIGHFHTVECYDVA